MIILVRHGLAVPGSRWSGDDERRPLIPQGERQAVALAALLKEQAADVVLSSPALRCKATVRPLAGERDVKVKTSRALREGRGAHALDLVLDTVGDAILCTHGDVVEHVLEGLRHLGWPLPSRLRKAKGSVWLLSRERCDYLPPVA